MRGALALCLSCAGAIALAQQPPSPAGLPAIAGQVMAAAGDAPLRRARIEITAGRQQFDPVLTDDRGRFEVDVTGAGPFTLTVAKAGYVLATARFSRVEASAPLVVRLPRGAVIAGLVVDQHGRPVSEAPVVARRLDGDAAADGVPVQFETTTDDLGEYRLSGLSRGRYEIRADTAAIDLLAAIARASSAAERAMVLRGVPPSSIPAQLVQLEPGDEVVGLPLAVHVADPTTGNEVREPPAPGAAAGIRGRVITEANDPIYLARVRISGAGFEQDVTTDAAGRFSLFGLRAGDYTLQASKAGYAGRAYGQTRAGQAGRAIGIGAEEAVDGIDIVLPRGLAMTGTIVDEHGEPLQGVRVQALQVQYASGRDVAIPAGAERRTDDRGSYRLSGLLPGTYLVAASIDAAISGTAAPQTAGYAPVYSPGTSLIASAVAIPLADDLAAVNLVIAPSMAAEIRGMARDRERPLVGGTAQLMVSRRSGAVALPPRSAAIQADGTFRFSNVAPGEYHVQLRGDGAGRTGLFGTALVNVPGGGVVETTIQASYGATIEVRLAIEGDPGVGTCAPRLGGLVTVNVPCRREPSSQFTIVPVALDDGARVAPGARLIISGDTFSLSGLFGPTAFALSRAPGDDWYLKSMTIGGVDVTEAGFDFGAGPQTIDDAEIVVSQRSATISGRLGDEADAAADYSVIVFPALRSDWVPHSRRMKFARARGDGSFRVAGLPSGDYLVAAVDRIDGTADAGEWQNPRVLEQLAPAAARVSVDEGQSQTTTLRLVRR